MTVQLTKAQIEAIKVELAKVGLSVSVARKPRAKSDNWLSRVKAWKPETPAGRACKSSILKYAELGPIKGITRFHFQVPGLKGYRWLSASEIHNYHDSLGAVRPTPRNLLIEYQGTPNRKQVLNDVQYLTA